MLIVGDVHGKVNQFLDLVSKYRERSKDLIIQLGDLGFQKHWNEVINWCMENNEKNLRIIPGNHDDYTKYKYKIWLLKHLQVDDVWQEKFEDGSHKYFGLRGANSIDKRLRTEGKDWFVEEELTYEDLQYACDWYYFSKPKYMFSHTCPSSVKKQLFGYNESSRTEQALQVMFEQHQPEIHFFGHFHSSRDEIINGTRFICLAELQSYELNL